jgi:Lrp/AsnC family transcriptional regulator for asnA, asnC and gidA
MRVVEINERIFIENIDDVDQKIIALLQDDGRVPFSQIAEKLNVSPGMVRVRYNRLVEMGFLRVVAITNPLKLGYKTMALLGIRVEGKALIKIAEQIAGLEEVIYLIITSGAYDIMAEVICRDHAHLLQFLTEKLYSIDGVRESETFMHLKIMKEVYF